MTEHFPNTEELQARLAAAKNKPEENWCENVAIVREFISKVATLGIEPAERRVSPGRFDVLPTGVRADAEFTIRGFRFPLGFPFGHDYESLYLLPDGSWLRELRTSDGAYRHWTEWTSYGPEALPFLKEWEPAQLVAALSPFLPS